MELLKKKNGSHTQDCIATSDKLYYYNVHQTKAMADFTLQIKKLKKHIQQIRQTPVSSVSVLTGLPETALGQLSVKNWHNHFPIAKHLPLCLLYMAHCIPRYMQ